MIDQFASVDATADVIGRHAEVGATDFTFYPHNPGEPLLDGLVEGRGMATRDQFERTAVEVFGSFRG